MNDLLQAAPPDWRDRVAAARAALTPARAGGAVLAAVVLAVAAVALLRPAPRAPALVLPPADGAAGAPGGPPAGTPPGGVVTVHVAGGVASPGVYSLPAGSRVADAVTAAGGLVPEVDVDRLNLAAKVADGDRVLVPRRGEPSPADGTGGAGLAGGGGPPVLVDLNTATAPQLDALPGVGPATAQAILAYRGRHGRFRSVTQLLEVPGIGPAKLEALRPLVRV